MQRLNAAELDVFLGPDYLVTLPNVELLPVDAPLPRAARRTSAFREQLFAKGSGRLLYEVLDDLFDYCFPILDKIGHKLDTIEDEMFEGRAEDVVRDISNVKQEIISYRKIIKPERSTLRLLERHVERFLPEELDLYFDDIVDAAERIWDLLDNYKEVVEALESTNESVISHRQNDVLRLLTADQRHDAAADADHRRLRHERALPGRGHGTRVLGDRRRARRGARWRWSASSATSAGSRFSARGLGARSGPDASLTATHFGSCAADRKLSFSKAADQQISDSVYRRRPGARGENLHSTITRLLLVALALIAIAALFGGWAWDDFCSL